MRLLRTHALRQASRGGACVVLQVRGRGVFACFCVCFWSFPFGGGLGALGFGVGERGKRAIAEMVMMVF